tara:strand:+ start:205 stop:465 length:261 start_codon:yes stop_codon:yes gene_type:complete
MDIKLSNPKLKVINIEGEPCNARMASAKEYDEYQKKVLKKPEKITELMIGFLQALQLPEEKLWLMTFEDLQQLVTYLTLGSLPEGK